MNPNARLFVYRFHRERDSSWAVPGGLDALLFNAGIGERICRQFDHTPSAAAVG